MFQVEGDDYFSLENRTCFFDTRIQCPDLGAVISPPTENHSRFGLGFPPLTGLQPLETAPAPWTGFRRSSPRRGRKGLHLNSGWPYIQYYRSTTDVDLQRAGRSDWLRSGLSGADDTCPGPYGVCA